MTARLHADLPTSPPDGPPHDHDERMVEAMAPYVQDVIEIAMLRILTHMRADGIQIDYAEVVRLLPHALRLVAGSFEAMNKPKGATR